MIKLETFKPLVYAGVADKSSVIAPPYDIITAGMRRQLYAKSAHNVVRLILGRRYPSDTAKRNCYTRAAAFFAKWKADGLLARGGDKIRVLEQKFEYGGVKYVRTGIMARLDWSKTNPGSIIPHERTYRKHREDRSRLLKLLPYNFSPVFLITDGAEGIIRGAMSSAKKSAFYTLPGEHGILYDVSGPASSKLSAFMKNRKFVIADGHHRLAVSYRNYRRRRKERYTLVYITDFSSRGCLILSHADRKTAIPLSRIRKVIKERKLMPQKSTFFWPKIPSGLLIHPVK